MEKRRDVYLVNEREVGGLEELKLFEEESGCINK